MNKQEYYSFRPDGKSGHMRHSWNETQVQHLLGQARSFLTTRQQSTFYHRIQKTPNQSAILSEESMGKASGLRIAALKELLEPKWNVTVVIHYRRLFEWLQSYYNMQSSVRARKGWIHPIKTFDFESYWHSLPLRQRILMGERRSTQALESR